MSATRTSAVDPIPRIVAVRSAPCEQNGKPYSQQTNASAQHLGLPLPAARIHVGRAVLLIAAFACLFFGVWGGLVRLYWSLVPLTSYNVNWVTFHGPLMVCGFLGSLIGLERATALERWWGYSGPVLTAGGALALVLGVIGTPAPLLVLLGSVCVAVVSLVLMLRQPTLDPAILVLGTLTWFGGNALWLYGWTIHQIIFWWIGFVLLTVFAERLELSRFLSVSRSARVAAAILVVVFIVGLPLRHFWPLGGERTMGAAIVGMAIWLLRYDVARRTIRRGGLPRFMAASLLGGYVWLGIVGLGLWMHEPLPPYGVLYDSILHAFFLGFVFAMIFAHAPIIVPAVVGVPVSYTKWFYAPLVVLHVGLVTRIVGDVLSVTAIPSWPKIHGVGGLLNATAIGLFLLTMFVSAAFLRTSQVDQQKNS
jgi:hypothetical protein